jgi:predicted rRNA methylase YqxC with S4 and FtsJ domains
MRYFSPNEPTPIQAADDIADIIRGKVVYDLGSGDGTFALSLAQYAKEVVAVELDIQLVLESRSRGVRTINEDYLTVDLFGAEVLFIFMSFYGTMLLTKRLKELNWHGIVISHYYPLHETIVYPKLPNLVINNSCPLLIYTV